MLVELISNLGNFFLISWRKKKLNDNGKKDLSMILD